MKVINNVLKIICIIIIIIIGLFILWIYRGMFDEYKQNMKYDYYKDFKTSSPLEEKYSKLGNYRVSQVNYNIDNQSMKKIRVWYPSVLKKENKKYPMVIICNATGAKAKNYKAYYKHLASWGFIVVGDDDPGTGNGETTSIMLDYILNVNSDSVLYNKIDTDNIGISGFSQGGAGAIRAVTEFENGKYYKTIFTVSSVYSLFAKNMGWGEYDTSKINIPYFMAAGTGISDDRGVEDIEKEFAGFAPLKSIIENYSKISDDVSKIRARVTGAEHADMLVKTDAYMTAWMLYQLQNDEEASKIFSGENAEILNNSNWQDIEKNF